MKKFLKLSVLFLITLFVNSLTSCFYSINNSSSSFPFVSSDSVSVPSNSNSSSSSLETKEEFELIVVPKYQDSLIVEVGEDFIVKERIRVFRQYNGKRDDIQRSLELENRGIHKPDQDPTDGYTYLLSYDKDSINNGSVTVYYNNPYKDIEVINNNLVTIISRPKKS